MSDYGGDGIYNARIESTMLGPEDHGIFTAMVALNFGSGSVQGFGGYSLRERYAHLFIARVLELAGAREWEKLRGCYVRAHRENRMLTGLGHALEDEWFYPGKEWADQP